MKKWIKFLPLIAACAVMIFVAGCNKTNDTKSDTNAAKSTFSEDFQSTKTAKKDNAVPKRVVALNSTNVEIIHALDKDDALVGVDRSAHMLGFSYLDDIKDIGHPYRPNIEGIISLKPDLVLATEENIQDDTAEQLRSAGVKVIILEKSYLDGLTGLDRRIKAVAAIFNEQEKGTALIKEIDSEADALKAKVDKTEKKPKIFFLYAHGPSEAYITGGDSGSDVLIRMAGGTNAAAFTKGRTALTAEAMVKAEPDAIIMLARGIKAVGGIDGALKLPGVALTPAGKNRKIIAVDDSIRWVGPRFPEFASTLFDEIHDQSTPQ